MRKFRFILVLLFLFVFPLPAFAVLVGPYSGAVLDSRTGDPIEGASVLLYWTKIVGRGPLLGPASFPVGSLLNYTDSAGKYKVSKFNADIGLLSALEATHILIYQPGYEAYIGNIWHIDWGDAKKEATTKENYLVKLDRIQPGFNHAKHVDKIQDALRGLEYPDKSIDMIIVLNENEFLRRIEWEQRRKDRQ